MAATAPSKEHQQQQAAEVKRALEHVSPGARAMLVSMSEVEAVTRAVDFAKVDTQKRRALAGVLVMAATTFPTKSLHNWSHGFLRKLICDRMKLPVEAFRGMLPLLGERPMYDENGRRKNGPVSAYFLRENDAVPFIDALSDIPERSRLFLALLIRCIGEQDFDSRARSLFARTAILLQLPEKALGRAEDALVMRVAAAVLTEHVTKKKNSGKWWKIGIAGVIGGGLLVVTGGLAAPALLAGVGTLGGVLGGGFAAVTGATVAFFSTAGGGALLIALFGAGGTSLASKKMAKRIGDLKVFEFERLSVNPHRLHDEVSDAAVRAAAAAQGKPLPAAEEKLNNDVSEDSPKSTATPQKKDQEKKKSSSWMKKLVPDVLLSNQNKSNDKDDSDNKNSKKDKVEKAARSCAGMHVFICISGLLFGEEDSEFRSFHAPWGGVENAGSKAVDMGASSIGEEIEASKNQNSKATKKKTESKRTEDPKQTEDESKANDTSEHHESNTLKAENSPFKNKDASSETNVLSDADNQVSDPNEILTEAEQKAKEPTKIESASGWFRRMVPYGELYSLTWEPDTLLRLGNEVSQFMHKFLMGTVKKEILKHTILHTVLSAWSLPSQALKVLSFIDSTWSMAIDRAEKAGRALADVLASKQQGNRPVTLIGYSMGARVIFECMEELYRRAHSESTPPSKREELFELVYDVILLGAPVTAAPKRWMYVRRMTAGRVVNCYCVNDFVLRYLYRASNLAWHVAGVGPVGVTDNDELAEATRRGDTSIEVPEAQENNGNNVSSDSNDQVETVATETSKTKQEMETNVDQTEASSNPSSDNVSNNICIKGDAKAGTNESASTVETTSPTKETASPAKETASPANETAPAIKGETQPVLTSDSGSTANSATDATPAISSSINDNSPTSKASVKASSKSMDQTQSEGDTTRKSNTPKETDIHTDDSPAATLKAQASKASSRNAAGTAYGWTTSSVNTVGTTARGLNQGVNKGLHSVSNTAATWSAALIEDHSSKLKSVRRIWFNGVENIDVSSIVGGHMEYPAKLEQIMEAIELEQFS